MAFLADDTLEGRAAGTRGEALAALYIETEYKRLGLEPGAETGFVQPVPLRSTSIDLDSTTFEVTANDSRQLFTMGDDIVIYGDEQQSIINASGDLVFAGHGIDAPELGINDYADIDVNGKFAVVFDGPPAFLPAAEAAHFGKNSEKQKAAAHNGAIGLIRIYTPQQDKKFPFTNFRDFMKSPTLSWHEPNDANLKAENKIPSFRLNYRASKVLFEGYGRDLGKLIEEGESASIKGFPLKSYASLKLVSTHNDSLMTGNVAGVLRGRDPLLNDEFVVVTAHYDHVGICRPEGMPDRICNGAIDNAFGVASMLDVARQLSILDSRPLRSVLFLAVGAEEEGLLGSDYFVNNPTIPPENIVANINMDGGLPFYDFSDVIAFGSEQSELGGWLTNAIKPMNLVSAPDPFPEENIFTRSDQYSFVKAGVPALFLYNGFTDMHGNNVGQAIWDDMIANHYHSPSDDLDRPIDYAVAAKYADVFKRVLLETANAPTRPRWYEDSIFGIRFAPNAPKAEK